MPKGRLAPLALLLAAACVDRGPPVWAPSPNATGPASAGCVRAEKLIARAPGLFEEGRIDRVARVLQRAEDLCPAEAPATWALRVRALAAVGRSAEAVQLATRIERSDRAGDADRAAAKEARAMAEAHGKLVVERGSRRDAPELFDPNEKRRAESTGIFHRAAAASRAGDHAGAKKLFLDAWEAWHPNPRALVEAGIEARLAGARAEAQTLWDRAAYDDTTIAVRPEVPSGAPAGHLGHPLAWSAGGDRIAVGGDVEVDVFDTDLHLVLRLRTKEPVLSVAFAPDGSRILAGLEDGNVRVFDTVTGAERDLAGHRGNVRAVTMAADLHTVASAGEDGTVRLWDTEAGVERRMLRPPRPAVLLAFDAGGTLLAGALEDGRIALWDPRTGALAGTLAARGGPVRAMAFDGASLDVVTAGERVRWDVTRPKQARSATAGRGRSELASVAVAAGRAIVAALPVAGLTAGAPVAGLTAGVPSKAGAASPKGGGPSKAGSQAGSQTDADLTVADLAGTPSLASYPGAAHEGIASFALSPSGAVLAVVYKDGTLALLAAAERRDPGELSPGKPIDAMTPSPDGRTIAAASDGQVLLWRAEGDRLRAVEPSLVRALAFSPDGHVLAMGTENARIDLRDLAGGKPDLVLETDGAVQCLTFSLDGGRVVAGTAAPSVQIFSSVSPGAPRTLHLAAGPVRAARFSPDGSSVLVASHEGLTMWNPTAREGIRFVPYGTETRDAVFTPDGSGMAVANQRGDLLLGRAAANAPAPAQTVLAATQVFAIAVARDGVLATAEGDRAIALRGPNGKVFQRFRDPDAAVRSVAFLSSHVAAGLGDGSVRLHRAPEAEAVAVLRVAPGLPPGKLGGIVSAPRGHLEVVGPDADAARAAVRCRLGAALYPLEVCAEQFVVEGLLPIVLSGKDPAEVDP